MTSVFVDTNILVRLFAPASPEHARVCQAISRLEQDQVTLLVGTQVLVELWVVTTRPTDVNGFGWSAHVATRCLEAIRQRFGLLHEDATTLDRWLKLVTAVPILGKRAHDARIAALMQTHGTTHLLTLNGADFTGMGVTPVHPDAVAK